MTPATGRVCPACGMEYDWPGVPEWGMDYCCDACARGQLCTCPSHQHGYGRGEPLSSEEAEQIGLIIGPME